ncbi:MAG TPA: response regulator transcription factor [Vicinamibacterales bacterium]|nr:response regulator transcription factor [Vicinamibacterales bacterium]
MRRVLIVEDEQHLAEGLRFNLEAEGYDAHVVETGEAALARLLDREERFDLVVLDVMLPGKDGFTVVAELRAARQFVPVLILTARGRPEDVLKGFAAGADDYLPKPTELAILLARIGGLLRRAAWLRPNNGERYTFNGRMIDFERLQLTVGDRVLHLTLMEANLLKYLIAHEGKAVSRKAMLEDVWGLHESTDTRAIDNFVVRLRRYIEDEPARPKHLLTVRSVGYRFVAHPA